MRILAWTLLVILLVALTSTLFVVIGFAAVIYVLIIKPFLTRERR